MKSLILPNYNFEEDVRNTNVSETLVIKEPRNTAKNHNMSQDKENNAGNKSSAKNDKLNKKIALLDNEIEALRVFIKMESQNKEEEQVSKTLRGRIKKERKK